MICRFCGEDDGDDLLHSLRCNGQQGRVEAAADTAWPDFRPHEHARTTDPDTSYAAAARVTDATEVQQRVLALLGMRPMTDEEILAAYERRYGRPDSRQAAESPRKRRSDLVRLGLVVDSGERRLLTSGRMGVVWRLTTDVHAVVLT